MAETMHFKVPVLKIFSQNDGVIVRNEERVSIFSATPEGAEAAARMLSQQIQDLEAAQVILNSLAGELKRP